MTQRRKGSRNSVARWIAIPSCCLVLGLFAHATMAQVIPPTQDFVRASDVVGWRLPNDVGRRVLFPERDQVPLPVPEFASDLTSVFGQPLLAAPAGAGNRYLRLTEPASGAISDILAVRVTAGVLTLNFWSDDPTGISPTAFLSMIYGPGFGSIPFSDIVETGRIQDVNSNLFPTPGSSPFAELFVASDLDSPVITDPGRRITGTSDFLALSRPGEFIRLAIMNEGVEAAGAGTPIPIFFNPPEPFNPSVRVFDKRIDLIEDDGTLSDILLMDVDPRAAGGFNLIFSLWSEDPTITAANFFANSGFDDPLQANPNLPGFNYFTILELGHRPLRDLLFRELPVAERRSFYDLALVGSDPPLAAPEPGTLALLAITIPVLLSFARRHRREVSVEKCAAITSGLIGLAASLRRTS